MPAVKIPDGSGGWIKIPTVKGDQGITGASGSGTGDMVVLVYDSNADGTVNDSDKLGGQLPSSYAPNIPATISNDGLMIAIDKSKLDGIASGATNYTHPINHPPSIVAQDMSNRFTTDTEKTIWNSKMPGTLPVGQAILIDTPGTSYGRLTSIVGVADWVGWTLNASFNGSGWVLDNPALNGWLLKMDVRAGSEEYAVYLLSPGAGVRPLPDASFRITPTGQVYFGAGEALHTGNHGSTGDPHTQYALDTGKGVANGYAGLDETGKVPVGQLPSSATGSGDMVKSVYDLNADGIVNDSDKLGGIVASGYATSAQGTLATNAVPKGLATATDQVMVSTGIGVWAVKTLATFKTWLGLGSAAYTASTNYATSAQGTLATNALPKTGGTLTGILTAQANTSYTVAQMHNVILSTTDAVLGSMGNGTIWIKYV